jgi:hypothetical protein
VTGVQTCALPISIPTPPEPSPKSVTAAPDQSKVSVSKKGGAAANPALKSTKALRQAQVKNTQEKMKAGTSSPKILNPTTPTPAPQTTHFPIEKITDLRDTLPIDACVELTRRLLTADHTFPSGADRCRAVLKIVVLFVVEYGSTA